MYQTVGHHAIELYSQAMGLPLFRRTIEGKSIEQGKDYVCNSEDEVEDLYELLKNIKVSCKHFVRGLLYGQSVALARVK